jgi:hypothetical protein
MQGDKIRQNLSNNTCFGVKLLQFLISYYNLLKPEKRFNIDNSLPLSKN